MPDLICSDLPGGLTNVAAWGKRSSSGSTKYEIVLWNTGHISCDCPGFTFKRKDSIVKYGHERWCKHIGELWEEARQMFAQYSGNSRRWEVKNQSDDNEPDVIPRVKGRSKPVAADPVSLRPTRAFEV